MYDEEEEEDHVVWGLHVQYVLCRAMHTCAAIYLSMCIDMSTHTSPTYTHPFPTYTPHPQHASHLQNTQDANAPSPARAVLKAGHVKQITSIFQNMAVTSDQNTKSAHQHKPAYPHTTVHRAGGTPTGAAGGGHTHGGVHGGVQRGRSRLANTSGGVVEQSGNKENVVTNTIGNTMMASGGTGIQHAAKMEEEEDAWDSPLLVKVCFLVVRYCEEMELGATPI